MYIDPCDTLLFHLLRYRFAELVYNISLQYYLSNTSLQRTLIFIVCTFETMHPTAYLSETN